jgi:hypothetical protein
VCGARGKNKGKRKSKKDYHGDMTARDGGNAENVGNNFLPEGKRGTEVLVGWAPPTCWFLK